MPTNQSETADTNSLQGQPDHTEVAKAILAVLENSNDLVYQLSFDPPISLDDPIDDQVAAIAERARFTYANEAIAKAYGFESPEELLGRKQIELMPLENPSTLPTFRKAVEAKFKLPNLESIEQGPNGKLVVFDNCFVGIIQSRLVYSMVGIAHDVTSYHHNQSKEKLRLAALDATSEACIIVDAQQPDLPVIYVNDSYLKMTGYSSEEVIGKNPRIMQGSGTDPDTVAQIRDAIKSHRKLKTEILNYRKDGTPFWNALSISPVQDDNGTTSHYVGIMTDATAQKSVQRALQQKAKILEASHDCIISTDTHWRINSWNAQAEEVYGFKEEEATGANIEIIFPREELQMIKVSLARKAAPQDSFHCSIPNRRKSGEDLYVDARINRETDPHGKPLGYIICTRDITERIKSESSINTLKSELAHIARISIFNELSSSLAHELNQPLAANMGNAQAALRMLEFDNPDLDEIKEILTDIVSDNRRAGAIVSRLRSMMKKNVSEQENFSLNDLIHDTLTLLRSDLIIKQTHLQLDLQNEIPNVFGDRIQIQQTIINLVKNATEAILQASEADALIRISTRVQDDNIVCEVADSGPGIPEEKLEQIFAPFFTTKEDGMGMGLRICRSIIEDHGGTITATSNPRSGSTFTFTLPIDRTTKS
ncbi:PAS domain S-box protein [Pelagicoccus mobilis]|uniref:histidine kinase n=1 Tax=Pelagicoccus mobilis TaxID=415221 RepID=A0A934RWR6_9BACT|nr:PAS domain S-box protein [Pelagicoccus mobilis]MBK1877931.1 PAS domain S-box protein [Pelagicoccus mobilis]